MSGKKIGLIVLLMLLSAAVGYMYRTSNKISEGMKCPERHGFPASTCKRAERCTTLSADKDLEKRVAVCGFIAPYGKELLCCPDQFPKDYVTSTTTTASPPSTMQTIPPGYKHLATLAYFTPKTLDDYVYRCTATILSPNQVLASSNCDGSEPRDKPVSVLVDESDPRNTIEPTLDPIKLTKQFNNDLTLFELNSNIDLSENVIVAKLCYEHDLVDNPKLHAVAYSQDIDGTNCNLFSTQLVKHDDCSKVYNQRGVENLGAPGLHICVKPIWNNSRHSDCKQCLTGSSSVLHVERADGSFCVAGIATPTTQECIVNGKPLYYTSIVSVAAKNFIRSQG